MTKQGLSDDQHSRLNMITFDALSNTAGTQTHRLTINVNGQPVGELGLDTKVE